MDETMSTKSDITKLWVFVNSLKTSDDFSDATSTSQVEDLRSTVEDAHGDSDTDSISVISESGGSCHSKVDDSIPLSEDEEENYEEELYNEEIMYDEEMYTGEIQDVEDNMVEPLCDNFEEDYSNVLFLQSLFFGAFLVIISFACQHFLQAPASLDNFFEEYNQGNVVTYCIHSHDYVEPTNQQNVNKYDVNVIAQHKNRKKNQEEHKHGDKTEKLVVNYRKYELPSKTKIDESPNNKNHVLQSKDKVGSKNSRGSDDDDESKVKLEKLKAKEEYLQNKEKFLIEKEHNLIKKEMKIKDEKLHCEKCNNHKHEKFYNNKQKSCEKNKKDEKRFNEPIKRHQQKGETHEKFHKVIPKSEQYHGKRSKYDKSQKRNITGQWYIKMSKGRNDMRKKERASDWVFERAHERSIKRNKARWYFQWMLDRERLRFN